MVVCGERDSRAEHGFEGSAASSMIGDKTGTGVQGDCLVGWMGQGILIYHHTIWNVNPPHPSHAWSPLPVGYLYIDYGEAPIFQRPEKWKELATRTLIDIPMYRCLYAVLCGRSSGPLVRNEEAYLVPALGETVVWIDRYNAHNNSILNQNISPEFCS